MDVKRFCAETYSEIYQECYLKITRGKEEGRRTTAQKAAMKQTFIRAVAKYPLMNPAEVWKAIQVAHVHKISGIDNAEIIEKVSNAVNSWKSSSGKAFEEMLGDLANPTLSEIGLRLLMPKEVLTGLKNGSVLNQGPDVQFLKGWLKSQIFDLYLVINEGNGFRVFGCVQAKTSIRDRVTRDREPSIKAMERNFLSIGFVLNAEMLVMPKYRGMVDGGIDEFKVNGWHAFYAFSDDVGLETERIHLVDLRMQKFVEHARKGATKFREERQWLDSEWNPAL